MPPSKPVPLQQKPVLTDRMAKERAEHALKNFGLFAASEVIFSLMSYDISQPAKYEIMKSFVDKHGSGALARIREEAISIGATYKDLDKLKAEDPGFYSRMNSLSYGIMLFKEDGFQAAIELIRLGKDMRRQDRPAEFLILYRIATTAAFALFNNKTVNIENAVKTLTNAIMDETVEAPEKEFYMRWLFTLRPEAACQIRSASSPSSDIRRLVDAHLEGELKGKVVCK